MTTYVLKPNIPGGTWLGAGILALGAILTAASYLLKLPAGWSIAGYIVMLLGLGLVGLTIVVMRRQRVWVTMTDDGYVVEGPRGEFSGEWIDVTEVAVSRKTGKIALYHGQKRRTIIAHPARKVDDELMKVREGIRTHLEELNA